MPNYKELIADFTRPKADVRQLTQWLNESFEEGAHKPEEFDFGKLFSECFGYGRFTDCRAGELAWNVMEAAGSVSSTAFQNVSTAIMLSAIKNSFEDEEFKLSAVIPDEQSKIIGVERIGDVTPIGDQALVVPEGKAFGKAGLAEDWFLLPEAQKRGLIVALTREAVFSDGTGKLLKEAANVGFSLGYSKENRLIDCAIDENAGAVSTPLGHRYCRKGTYTATYGNNSGTHNWDNLSATTTLNDWSSVDAAEQLLNAMLHPSTGLPIVLKGMHLLCTKQLEKAALRIRNATEIDVAAVGYPTNAAVNRAKVGNPYAGAFEVVTSRMIAPRLATDTTWFYGDLTAAFGYKVIDPIEAIMAPPSSHDEFHFDIIRQWRGREHGTPFTREPRAMITCTVA